MMAGHEAAKASGRRGVICTHQYLKYANIQVNIQIHTYPRADK